MKIIDCHAYFEPGLLDEKAIINRMEKHGIDQTYLMSAMTNPPIYNKSNFLMGIQRTILNSKSLWPIAKKLDSGFHASPGQWNPWYRKFLGKGKKYEILLNPNNEAVFNSIENYPEKLKGWIFINPSLHGWKEEFYKWNEHPGAIGVKIHPFWHRYSLKESEELANLAIENNFPLMIHMGFENLKIIQDFMQNFQELRIIFSHAAFPYYSQLWPLIKSLPNNFVDLSSHHVGKSIIFRTVSYLGPERCLYGTDDPYEDEKAGLFIMKWINSLEIDNKSKEMIFSGNILNITNK